MTTHNFISSYIHIIINGTTSKEGRNRHDSNRERDSKTKVRDTEQDCTGKGKGVSCGLGEFHQVWEERCKRPIQRCKTILQQYRAGAKSREESKRVSISSFIFLTILYLDLLDTYPYYALTCLSDLYKQMFIKLGVYR